MRACTLGAILTLCLLASTVQAQKCGQKQVIAQKFIINGYTALVGAWPWHGALFHRKRTAIDYACGVTILTEQFVITAAHCTFESHERQRLPEDRVFIKVGVTNLDSPERHIQQHDVADIFRHEEYEETTFENDIALMKLYTVITFNDYVQPICLWQGDTDLKKVVAQIGYVVGWGTTGYDKNYGLPKSLHEATLPIVSRKECISSDPNHYSKFYIEPKTFCAGHRNGTNPAPGDSGGGLFLRVGNNWVLRGIVSNAKINPNTLKTDPTDFLVFTDASYYDNWIKQHVPIKTSYNAIDASPVAFPASSSFSGNSNSQANLLNIADCGKDSSKVGTPEELKVNPNQYPWLAVIEYMNSSTRSLEDLCHGVLIHPRFLVTAGHCVLQRKLSQIRSVRLNDYRLDTTTDTIEVDGRSVQMTAERISVVGISTHPSYNIPRFTNNIGLIKIERPSTATPICLPPKRSALPAQNKFTIVGWKKNSRPDKPMIRNVVQLTDFKGCKKKYAEGSINLDTTGGQVCSKYSHDDDSNSCSHYMGSAPLQYSKDSSFESRYFLAALSSFGHTDCKRDDYADVFTYVAHYSDWILEKIKPYI